MKRRNTRKDRFYRNLRRTYKNKLMAILLVIAGIVCAIVAEGDITGSAFLWFLAFALFTAKENWVY